MSIVPGSGVNWGFNGFDLFKNSMSSVASIAPILLLILALVFVRVLVDLIRDGVVSKKPTKPKNGSTTRQKTPNKYAKFQRADKRHEIVFDDSVWRYYKTRPDKKKVWISNSGQIADGAKLRKYKREGREKYFTD